MPRSKSRNKPYKPRSNKSSGLLGNLPLPPAMLRKLDREMNDRLLRLHFSGINGHDLAVLIISFGQAWVLAAQMNEGEGLRLQLERGITELKTDLQTWQNGLSSKAFDTLFDLIEITSAVVAKSTKKEYEAAGETLKKDGTVPVVDDFFVEMAKVGLLEVIAKTET